MNALLDALTNTDFQWTTHVDSIWRDPTSDIPELQTNARARLIARLVSLVGNTEHASPLGVPVIGTGGAGKTHLLSSVRRSAFERGLYFVLVDMTDVREFWETVLLGYLRSLDQQHGRETQFTKLLRRLVFLAGSQAPSMEQLATARPPGLINRCNQFIGALSAEHRSGMREHQDVVRALVLLASEDLQIQDHGYQWLQGHGISESEGFVHGFLDVHKKPEQIVRGLSWLMSLDAPTVLALDQLDAIVAEHNLASAGSTDGELNPRQMASLAVIQSLAGGLSALRDVTRRTLTVVSSLETTWAILEGRAPVTMRDRFEGSLLLQPIRDPASIQKLIEKRLATAYAKFECKPEYASYPYAAGFFIERDGQSPRDVLKACHEHRDTCVLNGCVAEAGSAKKSTTPTLPKRPEDQHVEIEMEFEELRRAASVATLIERQDEEALDRLIEAGCEAFVEETPWPTHLDALVDKDFSGSGSFEPLHARLRVVDRDANDRELHYAFRFLESTHHISFQTRLKAAITAAGIDRDLGFRKLVILRTRPQPKGALSNQLVEDLGRRGGRLVMPRLDELTVLAAIHELLRGDAQRAARAKAWLRHRRPVSALSLFSDVHSFFFPANASATATGTTATVRTVAVPTASVPTPPEPKPGVVDVPPTAPRDPRIEAVNGGRAEAAVLTLGRKLVAGSAGEPFAIPLDQLAKHVVVLAGAGSGKTVLVRRIIEEAALAGIPSIVVDGANDLTRLGDAWPTVPKEFDDVDRDKSARYMRQAEVVVWTPGKERGNPLRLEPLPDFSTVQGDVDDFQAVLDMARSSLEPVVLRQKADKVSQGVLAAALRFFGEQGGGNLERLIEVLSELPPEANKYEKAEKLGRDAADRLRAEMETNPLFRGSGRPLDPAVLLHSRDPAKVRVSVVNVSGLPGQAAQQQFMNQLAMTLFSWIKKHPARGRALQGLLVVDEARDFVPSGRSVPGKESLIRLVAQARKYGLGIVFASQAPKSIDHNVVANCSTQFYGKQNAPAAIDTVREQLALRGSSAPDVAKLPRGTFYAFTDGLRAATKVLTPLCLSHHPSSPPDENEVLARAERSRSCL